MNLQVCDATEIATVPPNLLVFQIKNPIHGQMPYTTIARPGLITHLTQRCPRLQKFDIEGQNLAVRWAKTS